jgi:AcrR family transcriptional regulator
MGSKTLRLRHREQLRTVILDAAREEFVREGYENFSMRKLAGRIGYSPGTLYLHFENKADLLHDLIEEGFEQLLQALARVHDSEDPVQSLRNKLRAYIDFGLDHPNHYHFAFLLRRERKSETVEPHSAFDVLRRAVRRCVEEGPFDSLDVETTSQTLWATIHGITSLLIVHPNFPWVGRPR